MTKISCISGANHSGPPSWMRGGRRADWRNFCLPVCLPAKTIPEGREESERTANGESGRMKNEQRRELFPSFCALFVRLETLLGKCARLREIDVGWKTFDLPFAYSKLEQLIKEPSKNPAKTTLRADFPSGCFPLSVCSLPKRQFFEAWGGRTQTWTLRGRRCGEHLVNGQWVDGRMGCFLNPAVLRAASASARWEHAFSLSFNYEKHS